MSTVEPVIAGSRGFALALLAPLTERIGTRPRVAADAAHALPLLAGPGGLLVVEFVGTDTLRAIEDIVDEATGVRVVAAVPAKHAAADVLLRALGVEVARWDGTSAAILGAVGRQLSVSDAAQPMAPPQQIPPAAAVPAPPPQPVARPAPPDAIPAPSSQPVARAPAAVRTQPASAPRAAPLPPAPPPAWPAGVPGRDEAAAALGEALAGDAGSAGSIAARVAEGLSDLERSVLAGELQPFDDAPISDAAAMRVRVAAALATAPRPGDPIDAAAVAALLADFDALLSRVNAVAEDAPDGARAFIEPIRDDLVRLAIRFSQRASPAEPDPAPTAPTAAAPAPPARVRLLSIGRETHHPRRLAQWIALGAVVFLGGGYHAWTAHEKAAARAVYTSGLPAGLTEIPGPPGGPRVLVRASTTVAPDPAELSRFRAAEESKGNRVRESDGVIFVEPAPPAALPQPEAR